MQPIDHRNATWGAIQERLTGQRQIVYRALQQHGPCTTRYLAAAMEWDICSVRPRITELCQLDLAVLAETGDRRLEAGGTEGSYRAVAPTEWMARHRERTANTDAQLRLI